MATIFVTYVSILIYLATISFASNHINVCNFVPSDDEIREITRRGRSVDGDDYGETNIHKIVTIKDYRPHDHILVSVLDEDADLHGQYLYLVQGVLRSSGKPFGKFKSFDEYMHMRNCGDKEVFLDDEEAQSTDDEIWAGGVTFQWVAPRMKRTDPVDVIITKLNMLDLHRHRPSDKGNQSEDSTADTWVQSDKQSPSGVQQDEQRQGKGLFQVGQRQGIGVELDEQSSSNAAVFRDGQRPGTGVQPEEHRPSTGVHPHEQRTDTGLQPEEQRTAIGAKPEEQRPGTEVHQDEQRLGRQTK